MATNPKNTNLMDGCDCVAGTITEAEMVFTMKKGNKTELTIPIQDGYMIKQKEKCQIISKHKIINKWLYGICFVAAKMSPKTF